MHIRDAVAIDAQAVVDIYNHYVLNTTITFEELAVAQEDMARRIADVQAAELPWLVAEHNGAVVGYAYATKWRVRPAYRFSVESTVYLSREFGGQGIGAALYSALLQRLTETSCHVVIGGIAQPNPGSVALHEKLGFQKVGEFKEVGFKFDKWVDVGYWQLALRSPLSE